MKKIAQIACSSMLPACPFSKWFHLAGEVVPNIGSCSCIQKAFRSQFEECISDHLLILLQPGNDSNWKVSLARTCKLHFHSQVEGEDRQEFDKPVG